MTNSGIQVTQWCLQIYPEGVRDDTKDYVAINLKYTWVLEDFNQWPSRVVEVLRSETFFVTGSNIQVTQWCP